MNVVDNLLRWFGALPSETDREERQVSRQRLGKSRERVREVERDHRERVERARAALEVVRINDEDPPLTFEDFMRAMEGDASDADGEN